MSLPIAIHLSQGAPMSRRLNKVAVMAVFVVAYSCLIPVSSGANFNATKTAHVSITIQIPEKAPKSAIPPSAASDTETSPPIMVIQPTAPIVVPQPVVPAPSTPAPEETPTPAAPAPEAPVTDTAAPDEPIPVVTPTATPQPTDASSSITEPEGLNNEQSKTVSQ